MTRAATEPAGIAPWRAWLLAARPKTLWAAVAPVVVGTACAFAVAGFRPGPAVAALAGAVLIQIGTNFANDLYDYERGADNEERLGPTRAVQAGLLTSREMRLGIAVAFGLATVVGVYLVWIGGWPLVVIGLASIASGLAYTAGPYPLGYHGLGDLFVLVFFGFVAVAGTAYVQVGSVPELAWWAAAPVGCLATAVLVVNNLRDVETDRAAGKRTLAVRWGERGAQGEFALLMLTAYLVPLLLLGLGRAGAWILLPLLSAPVAFKTLRQVLDFSGERLNRTLASTALLLWIYSLLFALGLTLGRL